MTNNKPNDVRVVPVELLERISQTCMFTLASSDYEQLRAILAQPADQQGEPFQRRVQPWMTACFGAEISADRQERNHRFLEESLELVQACGATADEAHQLVDYVYGRPTGDPGQEVGGVMVTLAALCLANELDMHAAGETELSRIWTKVDQIRAKQAAKPAMSPLPGAYPGRHAQPATAKLDERVEFEKQADRDGANLDRGATGCYENPYVESSWEGWQARANLSGGQS